ncbi:MAG: M20/M25/M40 family metallo-hydrolase [Ferruginibacter sp.]
MIKISQLIISLFITFSATAQVDDSLMIRKIADEVLINGKAYDNLRFLCKKIGPRLSGSANAQKAVEATARMLKEAGADTVYLQPCMVPHWVRGVKETGYVELANGQKHMLKLCALGNSEGTGAKGITAPVIEVRNFAELDQLGKDVIKGKIIFFNFAMNPTYIATFRAYGESGGARRSGPSQAAKYGAIGVMVRSLSSNPDDYPHTGSTVYNDSFPKIPAVAISTNDADWLSLQLKKKMALKACFRNTSTMLPDVLSYNVVGEIRGTEFANEILTVGGHLDSWDLAEGAEDDGTGCVQSIEVIRVLKAVGIKPKHTIRAVMFMNEENGGRGGQKYLELAKANKEQHVFALESDEGGFTPRGFSLEMSADKRDKIAQWKDLFYEYGFYDFSAGGSGSDVGPLRQIGTALAGLRPDGQRYFEMHHSATDVFEIVSRRELHVGALGMASLIYMVDKYGL